MIKKSNYNDLILLTVLITFLIISSFIFVENYFNARIEEARVSQYQKQQLQISVQTSSSLKDFLEYVKGELFSLGLSSPPEGNYRIEKKFLSNYYGSLIDSIVSIVKTDEYGNIIRSSDSYLELDYQKLIMDNFVNTPQFNKDSFVTQVTIGENIFMIIAVPIYGDSKYSSGISAEFAGSVIAVIDTKLVEELYLSQINTGLNSKIILLDNTGTMLSRPQRWMTLKKGDNFFEWVKSTFPKNADNVNQIIAEKQGSISNDWHPNKNSLSSYSYAFYSAGYGWIIMVDTPEDEIKEGISSLQEKMLYFLIISIICFSIFFIAILLTLKSKEKTELQLQNAEITLEKLGIKANLENNSGSKIDISLKEKHIYMIQQKNGDKGLDFFKGLLSKDYLGLIISRESSEYIRNAYAIENTPIIKLAKPKSDESAVSIADCKDLLSIIKEFMEKNQKSAIYLDRLDYIIASNGFKSTIKLLYDLKDSMANGSIIIISINPNSLPMDQLNAISEEAQDITNLVFTENLKLSKDLYEILSYISSQNSTNKKVAFKDISKGFNITKPTTKKKITELSSLKLITVEESGREKTLSLTAQGMELLVKK